MARPELFRFPNPVDERTARLVAAGVLVQAAGFLITRWPVLLVALALGFVLRVLSGPRLSPLALVVTRLVVPRLPAAPKLVPGPPKALLLLATGAGAARTLALPGLTTISSGKILPDGHTLLVAASETGKPIGLWTLPLEGGRPRLVLPETAPEGMAVSPDATKLALHMGGGKGFILPLGGGPRTPIAGLEPGDRLDQWSGDGRSLYVSRPQEVPGKIFRIEIETGRRELWKELMPADPAGVIAVSNSPVAISRDGRSYAYSYARAVVSDLFLLGGVK